MFEKFHKYLLQIFLVRSIKLIGDNQFGCTITLSRLLTTFFPGLFEMTSTVFEKINVFENSDGFLVPPVLGSVLLPMSVLGSKSVLGTNVGYQFQVISWYREGS